VRLLDGEPVAEHYFEHGVRYNDGTVHEAEDEADARLQAELYSAARVRRAVYVMTWEDVSEGDH
jgi:hypothetical protein